MNPQGLLVNYPVDNCAAHSPQVTTLLFTLAGIGLLPPGFWVAVFGDVGMAIGLAISCVALGALAARHFLRLSWPLALLLGGALLLTLVWRFAGAAFRTLEPPE